MTNRSHSSFVLDELGQRVDGACTLLERVSRERQSEEFDREKSMKYEPELFFRKEHGRREEGRQDSSRKLACGLSGHFLHFCVT